MAMALQMQRGSYAGGAIPPSGALDTNDRFSSSKRRMTPELLLDICKERSMWSQPHLNTQLWLNFKGFDAIEGLELYTRVRTLHLGNNNIGRIEGLDRMADLRSLHLEGNRITCIENLDSNLELRQLNFESNGITRVTGIAHLQKLEQISLSKNCIEDLENLRELRSLPGLANIDVSHNKIEAESGVVEFWAEMVDTLKVLRYHGNPGVRNVEHYRKRLINALPHLGYLDERPVKPVERLSCSAWAEGGMEAMHRAKEEFFRSQHQMCAVDPDRRELVTRNRQAAIARIEREAKEREEAEARQQAELEKAGVEATAASSGDPAALKAYADAWQKKVSLYGADGVRARASQEAGSRTPALSSTSPDSAAYGFAPPQRGGGGAPDGPPRDAPSVSAHGLRRCHLQQKGASDFLAGGGAGPGHDAEGPEERQFAALGDDPWKECAALNGWGASGAAGQRGGQRGSGGGGQDEVVPDIWQKLAPAAKMAEMQMLEQSIGRSAPVDAPSAADRPRETPPAAADELNSLD
mmetsp:Transcript_94995/g.268574  ORF Transcript_94995/g.268574 Transcript_94995/m.268574 type:complete len:524 (-) Transcript_94995:80-1651(-)